MSHSSTKTIMLSKSIIPLSYGFTAPAAWNSEFVILHVTILIRKETPEANVVAFKLGSFDPRSPT